MPYVSFPSPQVPGLAESRPSVMLGDGLYVVRTHKQDGKEWQGYVHSVQRDAVGGGPRP